MTSINKLTKNSVINPGDLLVIWDEENQRTRSVSYDTLQEAVPYLESAEYVSPNLILTQSNGEVITVAIPSGGDVISGLLDGQVPVKDQATGQLVYSGASVNPDTGQWVFDRTIEVPSSSLDVGDVVTISEGSTELLISNNIDGVVSAVIASEIDSTGAKRPSYFNFGEEKSFVPQPYDSEVITTNPLIASSVGRVVSPDVRQINQTIFRADQNMPNTVAEIKDKASGKVIKYIPSRAAWEAETEEDKTRNPGLNFIAGDNVIDYVSREEDSPGVFNIGVSPFRLKEGQEFEIVIKSDLMALKGISGIPYLAEIVQDGPEVFLLSEDDQYIDEIIAGNNVTVDSTNPKKPVISASGGSGGAGVTIDVDGVEITTGVDTLDFDSATMTILDENPADGTVKISAKIQEQTNFIGLFNTVSDLQTAYPTPKNGMYASVLNADGKPDDRYKSQSDSWVGIGAVSGDVFVNDNKSLGIITGDGLKYEDDSGNAKISLSGVTPVIEFDVTIDSTRTVSPSMVGEVITIIQTPPVISIPMIISLEAHSNFSIGDTITISADRDGENPYTNYYFAVNYTDATGRNLVKYPANNITMIRTGGGWNVSMDGRFTNVSIRPKSQFGIPYAADEQYNTPVNAFVFAESDAVEFDVDEDTNTRIVKIDLDSASPDLDGYAKTGDNVQFQTIESNYGNDPLKHSLELKQDSNRWGKMVFTNNLVLWQWDNPNDVTNTEKTRFLTIAQSGFDFQRSPKYLGVKLATIEELLKVDVDGALEDVKTVSVGEGLSIDYDEASSDLKVNNEYALKDKISYSDEDQSTTSSGQGKLIEFIGAGSSSAKHQHTFTDSGTVWVSNFQITNIRKKTVTISTPTGVTTSDVELPVNMVLKSSYCKLTNKIITECSYLRPELIDQNYTYDGAGFGIPGKVLVDTGTVVQTEITGNYRNNSDAVGNLTINVRTDDGVKNWRFYYSIPKGSISARKVYVKVDEKAGTNKTINSGETWQCEIKAGQFFDEFFWSRITDSATTFVLEEDFQSKSGYNRLSSGGGSTHKIEFWENGSIFKRSNSKIEVRLLEGMQDEDGKRHGYVKYINSKGSDVNFEWYDRNGNQINNSSVPSVCPADTVVEIFANYSTDDYAINFSQSKVISSSIAEAQVPSFAKFINKSTVTVDYPLDANGDQYRPVNAAVMILDTDNLISDLNIMVTSSDSYDGHYNSIGVIAIDSNGEWTTQSRRNGYRLDDGTNTYCVYSDSLNSWVLVVASVDHNHIGSIVGGVPINLYNDGQLPESYGDYSIDNNLDSIESEYFTKADVDIDYHTNSGSNSYFTVNFGSAKPAGIIFFK